ncbi:MAG: hypothetical protein MUC78_03010 [Bacteroidales bacterium]|nr:hypothetical protein [Bacteroidales bacterium]
MKLVVLSFLMPVLIVFRVCGQDPGVYNKGYTAEQNLATIANISPYSPGGMGFDNRYEGVIGTRLVYDSLCPAMFRFNGQEQWIKLEADMDVVDNVLIFRHPTTEEILSIPAVMVGELIITFSGKELIYRTTRGMKFDKEDESIRFCQVLYDTTYSFIRVPYKKFIEANYKALYSPQRTYDEYESKERYYILGTDSLYHQVTLKKKSLEKLFPEAKELLSDASDKPGPGQSDEDYFIELLKITGK